MKLQPVYVPVSERATALRQWLQQAQGRLGMITSLDGEQLVTLVLNDQDGMVQLWDSPLDDHTYQSLTPVVPQAHWFERTTWDLFGLHPEGHPRLKHVLLHEPYPASLQPLRRRVLTDQLSEHRSYHFLEVKGDGVYEIPVGPIHAGIIEPGHFRFSCLGEIIVNLEIRLGYLHRGVEKRLTEVPWKKARFLAESTASDMAAAGALAHARSVESILELAVPAKAQWLRSIALEIERAAMHIADLGGIAGDIGFLAISSSLARLRGSALSMAELLTGSRLQRFYICPGGVSRDSAQQLSSLAVACKHLDGELRPVLDMFLDNETVCDRLLSVGKVSHGLARDFGLVGVAARASGIAYDCRKNFAPADAPDWGAPVVIDSGGDVMARVRVRIAELFGSLKLILELLETIPGGPIIVDLPEKLSPESFGVGIVESHRGELIHMVATDSSGAIRRYAIKDPSVNNWTALAISVRNSLVADFPLCNKSFSLSYGGHDV